MKKTIKISVIVISIILIFILACFGLNYVNKNNITYRDLFIDPLQAELQASDVSIVFFDVGCADCSLITYGDLHIMIDLGGNSANVINYLKDFNINQIDLLIATHSDIDHISGIFDLIDIANVSEFWCSEYEFLSNDKSVTFTSILNRLTENNTIINLVNTNTVFNYKDLSLQVLSPMLEYDNNNDNSLVIKMIYNDTSFLFTGDISKKAEKDILNTDISLSADVIKISHHGSKSSSTVEFLQAVNPKLAVVSVGENSHSLPSNEVIDRLNNMDIKVVQTYFEGNIYLTSNGKQITLLQ